MSIFNNLKWTALAQVFRIILQLISLTVLTRLLEPSQYGLMAMATVVSNFALIIRDLGTGAAIIQKKEIDNSFKSTVFWLNVITGFLISILIILLSPLIASVLKQHELVGILTLLSISFPIASLGIIHKSLLERASSFRKIAFIEIISSSFALVIALILAHNNAGVYSLIFQSLISISLSTIFFCILSPWRPKFIFKVDVLKSLTNFSGSLIIFNLVNYFSRNADALIIGRFFSSSVLGAYSLGYRIMLFPIANLTAVVSKSLYPIMSKNQEDRKEIKRIYLKSILFITSLTAPLMSGLMALREPLITIVFGNEWRLVSEILFWLAPSGFIQSIVSSSGSVFMSIGNTNLLMRLGFLGAFLYLTSFIIGAQYDIIFFVKLYFIVNIINIFPVMYYLIRSIEGTILEILRMIAPPILSSIFMIFIISLIKYFNIISIEYGILGQINSLILYIILGFFSYIFIYRILFLSYLKLWVPIKMLKLLV